ncbi:MAG: hypothetical protein IJ690_04540 [Clostridia bacterium]|nr:hypothetical protein [Clostridia bacterium]
MEFSDNQRVIILYSNWKGDTSYRNIVPKSVEFKSTEWHPEEQWILNAFDVDKQADRAFALKDIKEWSVQK